MTPMNSTFIWDNPLMKCSILLGGANDIAEFCRCSAQRVGSELSGLEGNLKVKPFLFWVISHE